MPSIKIYVDGKEIEVQTPEIPQNNEEVEEEEVEFEENSRETYNKAGKSGF